MMATICFALLVLLPAALASQVTLTRGRLTELTPDGTGSNKPTICSFTTDTPGRCLVKCLEIKACDGFNLRKISDNILLCDLKQSQPSPEDIEQIPGVRYVGTKVTARNCADLYDLYGYRKSGVYDINIASQTEPANFVSVYCDMATDGGKWMVLLRRKDGSVNFNRPWQEYLDRFGDLEGELWMGLDFMYQVTQKMGLSYELRVDLTSFPREQDGQFTGPTEQGYAKYSNFSVGSPDSFYMLHVDGFQGDWGDSLAYHNGMMFTANGTVNDHDTASYNCAETYLGPWWYNSCSEARLTGEYGMVVDDVEETTGNGRSTVYYHGIMWTTHLGVDEHPQFVEMKIRPLT